MNIATHDGTRDPPSGRRARIAVGNAFASRGRVAALCAGLMLLGPALATPRADAAAGGSSATAARAAVPAAVPARAGGGTRTGGDARALHLAQRRTLAPFVLTDQAGKPFRSTEAFQGRVSLVFFGFVNCPDFCPTTLLRLRNLLGADPALADVQVVMISVDGERDTPAMLKQLLDAIAPRFIGLTGPTSQVRPVARNFSASFARQPSSGPDGAYVVDHSAQLYLVDSRGRLATIFFNAPDETLRAVLRAAQAGG